MKARTKKLEAAWAASWSGLVLLCCVAAAVWMLATHPENNPPWWVVVLTIFAFLAGASASAVGCVAASEAVKRHRRGE